MKVDPNLQSIGNVQPDAVQNTQSGKTSRLQGSTSAGQTSQIASSSDTVQVSGRFAEVQTLTSQLQQVPDVRGSRVAMLRQQIQQGTYNPSASDIAGAMMNDPLTQIGKA